MKTIGRRSGDKKNFFTKHLYSVVMVSTLLVLGSVVGMTVWLTRGGDKPTTTTPPPGPGVVAPTLVLPLEEFEVAQEANLTELVYNPSLNEWRTVNGVVFGVKTDEAVHSVADGKVLEVTAIKDNGSVVSIQYDDDLVGTYMSLNDDVKVTAGQTVKAGDVIGTTSNKLQKYAHLNNQLYLEMKQAGKYIDPMTVLPDLSEKV